MAQKLAKWDFFEKLGLLVKRVLPPLRKMSLIFPTRRQYDLKDVLRKTVDQFFDIFLPRKIGFQN